MVRISGIREAFLHLLFPHVCSGCGNDQLPTQSQLCLHCLTQLPATGFERFPGNPVEKTFWGRLPLEAASAQFYFTKESMLQHLMHQFKYQRKKELGHQLGRIMGKQLQASGRFRVDALVPLPLFADKEKKRGYNQARVLCEGMTAEMQVPILDKVITRPRHTDTQTNKGRVERWKNIEGKFFLSDPETIRQKHLLLVDDVITTGATLESCGAELLKGEGVQLSLAAFCLAEH